MGSGTDQRSLIARSIAESLKPIIYGNKVILIDNESSLVAYFRKDYDLLKHTHGKADIVISDALWIERARQKLTENISRLAGVN